MRLRFTTHFSKCCLDTLKANMGTWQSGDRLTCVHCDSRYVFTEDGYWTYIYNTAKKEGD